MACSGSSLFGCWYCAQGRPQPVCAGWCSTLLFHVIHGVVDLVARELLVQGASTKQSCVVQ